MVDLFPVLLPAAVDRQQLMVHIHKTVTQAKSFNAHLVLQQEGRKKGLPASCYVISPTFSRNSFERLGIFHFFGKKKAMQGRKEKIQPASHTQLRPPIPLSIAQGRDRGGIKV